MMATVPHVTSGLELRKFQADGFLLDRVYIRTSRRIAMYLSLPWLRTQKIVRPSGYKAVLFMCHQYMLLTNNNLLNKLFI